MSAPTFVGVDISKATFHAAYRTADQPWQQAVFPNDQTGFAAITAWVPPAGWVVMEATGVYHLPLATHLVGQGHPTSVINPLTSRRFAQLRGTRTKTDAVDASTLAAFGTERPPLWQPSPLVYS